MTQPSDSFLQVYRSLLKRGFFLLLAVAAVSTLYVALRLHWSFPVALLLGLLYSVVVATTLALPAVVIWQRKRYDASGRIADRSHLRR